MNGVHAAETSLKAGFGLATLFAESISTKAVSYRLRLSRIVGETHGSLLQRDLSLSDTVQMECTVS